MQRRGEKAFSRKVRKERKGNTGLFIFFILATLARWVVGGLWSAALLSAVDFDDVAAGQGLQTDVGLNHQVTGGVDPFIGS